MHKQCKQSEETITHSMYAIRRDNYTINTQSEETNAQTISMDPHNQKRPYREAMVRNAESRTPFARADAIFDDASPAPYDATTCCF